MNTSAPVETPLLHGIDDAYRRLGIRRTTLYELLRVGRIRAVKVGARTLIPESELQRYVASLVQRPEAA